MYCIRVKVGQERLLVGMYSSAFIPSYISAEAHPYKGERKLVVPGYIFTIQKESKAILVPEEEWRIIEALSDTQPSFVDDMGKILSGPLLGLDDLVISTRKSNQKNSFRPTEWKAQGFQAGEAGSFLHGRDVLFFT